MNVPNTTLRENFNSHTREGVTVFTMFAVVAHIYFNSHTREGVTPRNRGG